MRPLTLLALTVTLLATGTVIAQSPQAPVGFPYPYTGAGDDFDKLIQPRNGQYPPCYPGELGASCDCPIEIEYDCVHYKDVYVPRVCYVYVKLKPVHHESVRFIEKPIRIYRLCPPENPCPEGQPCPHETTVLPEGAVPVAPPMPAPPPAPSASVDQDTSSRPIELASREVQSSSTEPEKRWIWLTNESVYGFGYINKDGYAIVDPNTKTTTAPR